MKKIDRMGIDWDLILSKDDLFHQKDGIRNVIKETMIPYHDDSFGSLTRTTESLSFLIRPGDKRYLKTQTERLQPIMDSLELDVDWEDISHADALSMLTIDAMTVTASRLERWISTAIWLDDPKKSASKLRRPGRLCKGLVPQITNTHQCVESTMDCITDTLMLVVSDLVEKADKLSVKQWGAVTTSSLSQLLERQLVTEDRQPNNFVFLPGASLWYDLPGTIFILPLATDDEEQGTFAYYSDMRNVLLGPEEANCFCTDAGRYLWKLDVCKWDYELSVTSRFKITTIPELSARIETGLDWKSLNKLLVTQCAS